MPFTGQVGTASSQPGSVTLGAGASAAAAARARLMPTLVGGGTRTVSVTGGTRTTSVTPA